MRRIPLHEFATEKGQVQAAALLGMSQGALSKALRVGRAVFVTEHPDGTFTAQELRAFPAQNPKPGQLTGADLDGLPKRPDASRDGPGDRRRPSAQGAIRRRGRREGDLTQTEFNQRLADAKAGAFPAEFQAPDEYLEG